MNEIEKLYENCNIQKTKSGYCSWHATCPYDDIECGDDCPYWKYEDEAKYPQFTAEKQIAIFKMFCRRYLEVSQHIKENGDLCFGIKATVGTYAVGFNKDFTECLADFVNCLWQDLTSEEKEQIRSVLNGN